MTDKFVKSIPLWFDPLCNSINVNNYSSNLWSVNCMTSQTFNNYSLDMNSMSYPYSYVLPYDINIFNEVNMSIYSIENSDVRLRTLFFISSFQQIIINNKEILKSFGQLPPLKLNIQNDQSVVIEWIFSNFRIGFCIEVDAKESSWYIVSNKMFDAESYSNDLNNFNIEAVIYNILNYVLKNK